MMSLVRVEEEDKVQIARQQHQEEEGEEETPSQTHLTQHP
jgi:hypothetical protein